jgi:hypothetical protein
MDTVTITLSIDSFYNVINAMRDKCGCTTCMRITEHMINQRLEQQ